MRSFVLRCLILIAATAFAAISLVTPANAAPDDGQWDPTLPKIVSSGAPGDPVAIANASFQVSQIALQTTQNLGQQFLQSIGLAPKQAASTSPAVGSAGPRPSSTRSGAAAPRWACRTPGAAAR